MRTGAAGLKLIESFETCKLVAYQDEKGVWTIGWGHTGPEVVEGLTWTQDQADAQFAKDLIWAENAVKRDLDIAVTQNQFDALVSFTFNDGVTAAAHSTLMRDVNACNFVAAAAQFPLWNHFGGVVSAGLTRRRYAEKALFETPA